MLKNSIFLCYEQKSYFSHSIDFLSLRKHTQLTITNVLVSKNGHSNNFTMN